MAGTLSAGRVEANAIAAVRRLPADAYGVAAIVLLTAVVAWDRLGDGQALSRTDILTAYLPWYAYLGEHLRALDIPAWNPHVFGGVPFAGDPQSGWMYLPAMLFFTLLPPVAAFTVFVLFHLVFGGLTTYAFARVLGMRVMASLLAGVAFEFGTFLEHTRCCTIRAQLAAWIPLALLAVELTSRAKSPLARFGWLTVAGFAASQMLAAWIGQGAYNGLLVIGSYLFYRTVVSPPGGGDVRKRVTRLIVDGGALLGIGFGLAAAGLLPRLDAVSRSNLAGAEYESGTSGGGWQPAHLLYRILNDEGTSVRWYIGGATLALALLAPLFARRQFAVPYFAGYCVVVLALSLDHFLLHDLFFLLPWFQELHEHVPNRVLAILPIGPALLAAATVETLRRWSRWWWTPPILIFPLLALAWADDVSTRWHDDWGVTARTAGAAVAVSALLLVAVLCNQQRARNRIPRASHLAWTIVPALLVAVVFWDPTGAWYGRSMRDTIPDPHAWQTVEELSDAHDPGGAGEFLQARQKEEDSRYFGYDAGLLGGDRRNRTYQGRYRQQRVIPLLVNNRAMRLGIDDIQGYNPVQIEHHVALISRLNGARQNYHDSNVLPGGLDSPLLDLLNVRYVVVPVDVPPDRPDLLHLSQRHDTVFAGNGVRVLERESALPRAWIVHDAREVEEGDALELLATGAVDPRQIALLETDPPALAAPPAGAEESVTITANETDSITLDVIAAADCLVVLSEAFSAGWTAYLDGDAVPVQVADHSLRAVPVPAGQYTLVLRYEPPALRNGLTITLATIVALGGVALFLVRRAQIERAGIGRLSFRDATE